MCPGRKAPTTKYARISGVKKWKRNDRGGVLGGLRRGVWGGRTCLKVGQGGEKKLGKRVKRAEKDLKSLIETWGGAGDMVGASD